MRPTFGAYGDIEARIGSLRQAYSNVMTGIATLRDMAIIVTIGLKAHGEDGQREFSEDKTAKLLFDEGAWSDDVIASIADFLAALGWTPEQRKKIAAEVQRQEERERSA
jgi:hypothetical protein